MSYQDIIRAWTDEEYRLSLSEEQRALLPEHPAGLIELEDPDLDDVAGGWLHITNNRSCIECVGSYIVAC